MNRREFAKMAGVAALLAPQAVSGQAAAPQAAPKAETPVKYGMSKEQEERVRQAVERRERQMAPLRSRTLPYELEPAFVFRVKSSGGRK